MLQYLENKIVVLSQKHSRSITQLAFGIIFIWFGVLKCLNTSPASSLILQALPWSDHVFWVYFIGVWEVAIGALILFNRTLKFGLFLFFLHVPGTFLPIIFAPQECFSSFPFELTLEGQYIFKNLILIAGAIYLTGKSKEK